MRRADVYRRLRLTPTSSPMPEYWFIVKPEHGALYETLRRVVAGRPGYHVIQDRRAAGASSREGERRTSKVWEGDEMTIAERRGPGGD